MSPDIVSPVHRTAPYVFGVQLVPLSVHTRQKYCCHTNSHHA